MSRWTEGFQQHPFRTTFSSLSEAVESAAPNENATDAAISELARLKRAVKYVEEMLGAVEPELTPLTLWETMHGYATTCFQQVQAFAENKNDGHINNANAHADHMISALRPFAVVKGRAARVFQASAVAFTESVEAFASDIAAKRKEAMDHLASTTAEVIAAKNEAAAALSEIVSAREIVVGDGDDKLITQIKAVLDEANEKIEEINSAYNELLVGVGEQPATKAEIEEAKEAAVKSQKEIDQLLLGVRSLTGDLKAFGLKIFGAPDDSGVSVGGLSDQFQKRVDALGEFETTQRKRYAALNEQIESLLPGATSAGLASAYSTMKDSFEGPIKNATRLFYWSIGMLVVVSFLLTVESVGFGGIQFVRLGEWTDIFKGLAQKLPFYGPIVWLAYFASKRRSEAQRLQQEYAHKEAFAKSYDGFKKQISELGSSDGEMLEALIGKAVDAISHNASSTLDGKHGDKMPSQDFVEKVALKVVELTSRPV